MKAYLMHPAKNFDADQALPSQETNLRKDLELDVLLAAMSDEDDFIRDIACRALLLCFTNDLETIRYRHDVLWDSLKHPDVVRQLYALTMEAIEGRKRCYWSFSSDHPSSILHGSIEVMQMFAGVLQKMRVLADAQLDRFGSRGLADLFAMLRAEFTDSYLSSVQDHLRELKFRHGILLSAELGAGNEGTHFVLRRPGRRGVGLLQRVFGNSPPSYTFRLAERDLAGAQAVAQMRNRGINRVANALAQSMDHIMAFFQMLRTELAFYVGCLNLQVKLEALGRPVVLPETSEAGIGPRYFSDLYDPCLALSLSHERQIVGNTLNVAGKHLVIITGANQGGKSSFLRSVGVAQLMTQSGMFVAAGTYCGALCAALYTHYKREEDATMEHGKLDEELDRVSTIAQEIVPDAIVLFNESFASTNEMEGAEIARQVTTAFLDRRIVVYFVTHLYTFSHGLQQSGREDALFLRAERQEDGTRTFRLTEGVPLETSYGRDLYAEVFER